MRNLFRVCSTFIVFTIISASDKNEELKKSEFSNGNSASNKQLVVSEVQPIDIEKITKNRIEKSIMDKKYAQKILKQNVDNNPNQKEDELSARKMDKKNVLKKWSADLRSKLTVVKFKGKNGEKTINLPLIPESN
tara:strand:+ start:468 stop:872 length:405 start_codon:yes stop_codon:yes gene_type:complete